MNKHVFDKSKLPSRHVSVGPARAPHRSYYYAMGMTAEEIAQPFIGVATCWNEAAPCNISLNRQAQSVKTNPNLTVIGYVKDGSGANLITRDDKVIGLKAQGFNHHEAE